MSDDDDKKIKKIRKFIEQGKDFFEKLEFDTAISCFSRAIEIYKKDILECPEIIDAYIDGAYALCYNDSKDMKNYDQAIENLSAAIQILGTDKDPETKAKAVADAAADAVAKADAAADAAAKAAADAAAKATVEADAAADAAAVAKAVAKAAVEAAAKAAVEAKAAADVVAVAKAAAAADAATVAKAAAKADADAAAVAKAAADAAADAVAVAKAAADAAAAAKATVEAKAKAKSKAKSKAYAYRAYAYYLKGNYDRAISGCNKALELLSSSVFARELLASLYCNTKDYHKVIENYKDAVNHIDSFSLTEKYKEACKKLNNN